MKPFSRLFPEAVVGMTALRRLFGGVNMKCLTRWVSIMVLALAASGKGVSR